MKLKNLRKKIRRLEKRLREGPKKLAKLRRKLQVMEGAQGRESAVRVPAARQTARSSRPIKKKQPAKTAVGKKAGIVKKVKRKVNLSPERRAQLAAAMKARWAAKKAAAEATPESAPAEQAFTVEATPQVLESRHDGA